MLLAETCFHARSCDFTAHMRTGMILSNYKFFVNPLFKLISIEHVIIGSKTQWKTKVMLQTGTLCEYKLRLHYIYTSQDDKITSDALNNNMFNTY